MSHSSIDITRLLRKVASGDQVARVELYVAIEDHLKARAGRILANDRARRSVSPTVLADDAFLQLTDPDKEFAWEDRWHFYRLAARAMRRMLIDHAKAKNSQKRGGGEQPMHLDNFDHVFVDCQKELIALDEALKALAQHDRLLEEIVNLYWFGGYKLAEVAVLTRLSVSRVKALWKIAKAWLHREMQE